MSHESDIVRAAAFDFDGTMRSDVPDQPSGMAFWALVDKGLLHVDDNDLDRLSTVRHSLAASDTIDETAFLDYSMEVVKRLDSGIGGLSIDAVKQVFEEQAEIAQYQLYPEIQHEIEQLRDENYKLVIISGSPDFFIQALAKHIEFDRAIGTHFHTTHGRICHGRRPILRSANKHLITNVWCDRIGKSLGRKACLARAYGDTVHDMSMLDAATNATVVNPKGELGRIAQAKGWRTITTADERVRV